VPFHRGGFHELRSVPKLLGAHGDPRGISRDFVLRRLAQSHDGELLAPRVEADVQIEPLAALSLHASLRFVTGRTTGESRTGLQSRLAIGGFSPMVSLVGSHPTEGRMRPMAVVLGNDALEVSLELAPQPRHDQAGDEFLLERADQPLDEGNAPAATDRAEPRLDLLSGSTGSRLINPQKMLTKIKIETANVKTCFNSSEKFPAS
jgi:hypothetical protein